MKTEGRKRRGLTDGLTVAMDMNLGKLWEKMRDRGSWHAAVHRVAKNQTRLGD